MMISTDENANTSHHQRFCLKRLGIDDVMVGAKREINIIALHSHLSGDEKTSATRPSSN